MQMVGGSLINNSQAPPLKPFLQHKELKRSLLGEGHFLIKEVFYKIFSNISKRREWKFICIVALKKAA